MKKRISVVTFHYMLITAGFWMSFCFVTSNAAIYLQFVGYSNVQLGVLLALGNVGGAVLSTLAGDFLDRHPQIRHVQVLHVLCAVQLFMLILLRLHPVSGLPHSCFYVLYCVALMGVNAVNLDLCVRLEHFGAELDFGLARAVGSLTYMGISLLLGFLIERFSPLVLLDGALVMVFFQFFSNLLIDRDFIQAKATAPASVTNAREKSVSLLQFLKQNRSFSILLIGITILFISHNIDNNFMINEVRALGGNAADMGAVCAFQALVEIPVMVLASRLPKKWSYAQYIRFAFVFFVVKMLAYSFAPSLPVFFAARLLQMPSYALYIVLVVPYADQVIPHQDSAKAQGLLVSVTNLGAVIASLAGGAMFDTLGVRPTMLIGTAIAALGCVVGILGAVDERNITKSK